jgi:hypothetical protein
MEQILTYDPEQANQSNVDHLLWLWCFYGPVDYFRTQMRKSSRLILKLQQSIDEDAEEAGGGSNNNTNNTNIELQKARKDLKTIQNQFKVCISESSAFYQGLIYRLEAIYRKDIASLPSNKRLTVAATGGGGENSLDNKIRCRLITLARCWIYIGDLARYKELHSDRIRKEWTPVRNM